MSLEIFFEILLSLRFGYPLIQLPWCYSHLKSSLERHVDDSWKPVCTVCNIDDSRCM